jgi:hypothetical protein
MLARKAFFGVSLHKASFICINKEGEKLIYLEQLKGDKRAISLIITETSTEPSFLYPPNNNYYLIHRAIVTPFESTEYLDLSYPPINFS